MPDQRGAVPNHADCVEAILVAVGCWELKNGEVHRIELLDLKAIILNDWVAQEAAARVVQFLASLIDVAVSEFYFEEFTDMDRADA